MSPLSAGRQFSLRRTTESDWPKVRALRVENATDNPISYGATLEATLAMTEDAWRLRAGRGEREDTISIAAIDSQTGRWIGMMGGQIGDDYGTDPVLTGVFVTPEWRGRQAGVASSLLATVEDWARRQASTLRLFVDENAVPARRFYDRSGFGATGRTRPIGFAAGNTLEMVKDLR